MEDGYISFPSDIGNSSCGCKISKAALRKLEDEPDIELDFENVFEIHKNKILSTARAMIKTGNLNPVIESKDI